MKQNHKALRLRNLPIVGKNNYLLEVLILNSEKEEKRYYDAQIKASLCVNTENFFEKNRTPAYQTRRMRNLRNHKEDRDAVIKNIEAKDKYAFLIEVEERKSKALEKKMEDARKKKNDKNTSAPSEEEKEKGPAERFTVFYEMGFSDDGRFFTTCHCSCMHSRNMPCWHLEAAVNKYPEIIDDMPWFFLHKLFNYNDHCPVYEKETGQQYGGLALSTPMRSKTTTAFIPPASPQTFQNHNNYNTNIYETPTHHRRNINQPSRTQTPINYESTSEPSYEYSSWSSTEDQDNGFTLSSDRDVDQTANTPMIQHYSVMDQTVAYEPLVTTTIDSTTTTPRKKIIEIFFQQLRH